MNDKELLATKIEGNYKSSLKNCSCYNKKLEQSQSNWNSLKNWVFEHIDSVEFNSYDEVLDKMNELEGKDKDE